MATTSCSGSKTNVNSKIVWEQPATTFLKQNKVTIDTTQTAFPYEYFCLSCVSEDYYNGSGASTSRTWNTAAPLYSSKVI